MFSNIYRLLGDIKNELIQIRTNLEFIGWLLSIPAQISSDELKNTKGKLEEQDMYFDNNRHELYKEQQEEELKKQPRDFFEPNIPTNHVRQEGELIE
jgi:hypothetical protein